MRVQHVNPKGTLTEDDVGTIEPRGGDSGDEELRAVGVLASVGHRELTGTGVLDPEVLVVELLAPDGPATGAIVTGEVTALAHELRNTKQRVSILRRHRAASRNAPRE